MEFLDFTYADIYLAVVLLVLLLLSATVSGAETAFFSLSPSDHLRLSKDESTSARTAARLLENPEKLLSSILIFNNLVNIGAILTANSLIDHIVAFNGNYVYEFVVKIVVVTFALLLFGEIMPKIFANNRTYRFVIFTARFVAVLRTIFSPISWLLTSGGAVATRAFATEREAVSIDTLQEAIQITESETSEDQKMLSGIVQFVQTDVVEIMKPRIDLDAFDTVWGFDRVRAEIIRSPYSRIPIYEDSVDRIRGILHIKDLLPYLDRGDDFEWPKLAREAYFVPENMKINDLLEEFQARRKHMAVVVDEYGGTLGVVTLEDVLEEIVGEISDERDTAAGCYKILPDGTYEFEGSTHLVDFERVITAVDEDHIEHLKGESDTLAGLMIEIRGDFFKIGEWVDLPGDVRLRADQLDGYRITKVNVRVGR